MRDDGADDQEIVNDNVADAGAAIEAQQAAADAAADPDPHQDDPFAELALEMGWVPRDQFRGDPDNWRPAKEYIKNGVAATRSLKRDLKHTKETVERIARTSAAITARELEKQRTELEARHAQAVEDGDVQAAKRAAKDMAALDREAEAQRDDPEAAFASENPWYGKDDEATAYAVGISQRLAAQGKSVAEQLEAASAGVRKRFPELFEDKKPTLKAPQVHAPASRSATPRQREKSFADLPEQAKQAWANFDRDFKRRGFSEGYPKDEYAREYWADAAA